VLRRAYTTKILQNLHDETDYQIILARKSPGSIRFTLPFSDQDGSDKLAKVSGEIQSGAWLNICG